MNVHSNSSLTCFRRCPREYQSRYVFLRRPTRKVEALRFGSFFHVGLSAWWGAPSDPEVRLLAALYAIRERAALRPEDSDPFDLVKAETLLTGYAARWGGEGYSTLAVEQRFDIPLGVCDARLVGAIDAIASKDGVVSNVEHKTTASDISAGSDYWRHVDTLDSQVSTYMVASRFLGHDVRDTLYDVVRKPTLIPLKATPEDAKKYTKPTKAEPIPRLYANQREEDETPEEYRERLTADIAVKPDWYFARRTVVRLERDDDEHERDLFQTIEMIQYCHDRGAFPRSVASCERYGRLCPYHEVCSGLTTIDDDTRFRTAETAHEELTKEGSR
jgi:hypothetical protein